jgi:hypothetical protein
MDLLEIFLMIDTDDLLDLADIPGVCISVERLVLKINRRQRKGENKHEPEFDLDSEDYQEAIRTSNRKRNGKYRHLRIQDG